MNIFTPGFWEGGAWQSVSVFVAIATCVVGPFISMWVEQRFHKDAQEQTHINAYKALWAREGSLGLFGLLFFLPIQLLAAYGLYVLGLRVLLVRVNPTSWLELSFIIIFVATWGLSIAKRKTLAKVLTWHFIVVMLVFSVILVGQKAAPRDPH